jgi:hypothetical protein
MKKIISALLIVGFCLSYSMDNYGSVNEENLNLRCAFPKFEKEYENSKAVFIGEVINVEKDGNKKITEFRVKKYWKGIKESKVKVTVYENPRFQSPFDKGETHLVFAKEFEEDEGLQDGRCSRSKDMNGLSSDLEDDLKKLGEAKTCINLQ